MNIIQGIVSNFISLRWKNLKLQYYLLGFSRICIPKKLHRKRLQKILSTAYKYDKDYLEKRVNYYNKLENPYSLEDKGITLKDFTYIKQAKTYFFDTFEYTRYFGIKNRIAYIYGDVIDTPPVPSIVKSRPIMGNNVKAILLNLDKVRHFIFVNDKRPFEKKEFKILWRGNVFSNQKNRVRFIRKFYNHPLFDIAHLNKKHGVCKFDYPTGNKMSLYEHLKYKFIVSLEGNDVATNLKWIMSSNSIAVMPKPRYEIWFMEGTLIPDYHYICVKDDFSDMVEKVTYYNNNTTEAEAIIRNANEYVKQFKDKKRERLISLLVLKKYFDLQE